MHASFSFPTEKTKTKRRANNEVIIKYIKRRGKSRKVMIWLQSGWDLLHRTTKVSAPQRKSMLGFADYWLVLIKKGEGIKSLARDPLFFTIAGVLLSLRSGDVR